MIEIEDKQLKDLKFIDLFCGIGGFHTALSSFGAECVFASEIDKYATATYARNYSLTPSGDITKVSETDIPYHDILCAGFPCQPFSISGKQKGFSDKNGTLFFDIIRILKHHNPKFIILENVKNIFSHNNGDTFKTIISQLTELNYNVYYKIVNAGNYGLPQKRERVFFFGFRKDIDKNIFSFNDTKIDSCLYDVLDKEHNAKVINDREDTVITKHIEDNKSSQILNMVNKPIRVGYVNKGGQGERIYHPIGHSITLSANGGGVGAKTGLYIVDGVIRKLSTRECARLQGFPESFKICENENQAFKQFGNSISINTLQYIINYNIKSFLDD